MPCQAQPLPCFTARRFALALRSDFAGAALQSVCHRFGQLRPRSAASGSARALSCFPMPLRCAPCLRCALRSSPCLCETLLCSPSPCLAEQTLFACASAAMLCRRFAPSGPFRQSPAVRCLRIAGLCFRFHDGGKPIMPCRCLPAKCPRLARPSHAMPMLSQLSVPRLRTGLRSQVCLRSARQQDAFLTLPPDRSGPPPRRGSARCPPRSSPSS